MQVVPPELDGSRVPGPSCAGEMEVDVLEFVVPVENNKTLFVWDIQPSLTEAEIYVSPPGGGTGF